MLRVQVLEDVVLRLDEGGLFGGVEDLQHEAGAARALEKEVLVALARERLEGAVDAEDLPGDGGGFSGGETRRVLYDERHHRGSIKAPRLSGPEGHPGST